MVISTHEVIVWTFCSQRLHVDMTGRISEQVVVAMQRWSACVLLCVLIIWTSAQNLQTDEGQCVFVLYTVHVHLYIILAMRARVSL